MSFQWTTGVCLACISCCFLPPIAAQHRVDGRNLYERVLVIVPYTGAGTMDDPKRPMYAPAQIDPTSREGILAYQCLASDDGRLALCEFVAKDRAAFKSLLADRSIRSFLKGQGNIAAAIAAFKALKKDFDPDHFGVRAQ